MGVVDSFPPGFDLGPWQLGTRLGGGAVGTVYKAQATDGRWSALKLVPGGSIASRMALLNEVSAAARLDHPAVLRLLDLGETQVAGVGVVAWLSSELCSDTVRSLRITRTWPVLRRLLRHVLAGLAHAHARGVLHRDLKPANLLVTVEGSVRIADFGVADIVDSANEGMGSTMGTPLYMAPEQAWGRRVDQGPWTDLYALGCVLLDVAAGRHPWSGAETDAILDRKRREELPLLEAPFEVPRGVVTLIARMVRRDPEERFQRAADVIAALDEADPTPDPAPAPAPEVPLASGLRLAAFRRPTVPGEVADASEILAGGPRIVGLTGGAGTGRSHLARAVCELAAERGAHVVTASWSRAGGPHDGLRAAAERDLRSAGLTAAGLRTRLGRWLDQADADDFTTLLRPEDRASPMPGAERMRVVRRWLAWRGRGRPVVVWLDDVAYGIEGQDLLAYLARHPVPDATVVVSGDGVPDSIVERRELGPREPAAVAATLRSVLPVSPLAERLLVEHAAGSPTFGARLLQDLAAADGLARGPSGWELRAPLRGAEAARAAFVDRVARADAGLDPRPLELLAVLGSRVTTAEWRAALPDGGADADEALAGAVAAGIVVVVDGDEVAFVHGGAREVLRDRAVASGRLTALADAAAAVVVPARDPLRHARLLADGSDHPRARECLRRAAILFAQQGRHAEALATLDLHDGRQPSPLELAAGHVIRARAWMSLGDWRAAEHHVQLALEVGDPAVTADAECAASGIARMRGDRAAATLLAEAAEGRFRVLGDPVGVARALALQADVASKPGDVRRLAEAAIEAFGDAGKGSALRANLWLRLANGRVMTDGWRADAAGLYAQARDIYDAVGDPASIAMVSSAIALCHLAHGALEDAWDEMDGALTVAERLDEPRAIAIVEGGAAQLAYTTGDPARAEALARSAIHRLAARGLRTSSPPELLLAAMVARDRPHEARALRDRVVRTNPDPTDALKEQLVVLEVLLPDQTPSPEALAAAHAVAERQPFFASVLAGGPPERAGTARLPTFDH